MPDASAILAILEELARRIAGPAEHIWIIYVKQAFYVGVAQAASIPFVTLASYLLYKLIRAEWFDLEDELCGAVAIAGGIILLCAWTIVLMLGFAETPFRILNPEYYALKDIIKQLK
jgi:hypothetical protein